MPPGEDAVPSLSEFMARHRPGADAWHIGPEHPRLEELGMALLAGRQQARILELGVQSGGFAVPVILSAAPRPGFTYVGVDNLEYTNAVPLRLVADYLALHGITRGIRLVEGDSTPVVRDAAARSFDLILLDHYKPKYPIDLYAICAREVLSDDGRIVLHDVLAQAAGEWRVCQRICKAFGYESEVDATVPSGAGIIRRGSSRRNAALAALVACEVHTRWAAHTAILTTRRAIGRTLRRAGLRR